MGVGLGDFVGVAVGVGVLVGVGVEVGVAVGVGEGVFVGVAVGVGLGVCVGEGETVGLGDSVGLGLVVGVGLVPHVKVAPNWWVCCSPMDSTFSDFPINCPSTLLVIFTANALFGAKNVPGNGREPLSATSELRFHRMDRRALSRSPFTRRVGASAPDPMTLMTSGVVMLGLPASLTKPISAMEFSWLTDTVQILTFPCTSSSRTFLPLVCDRSMTLSELGRSRSWSVNPSVVGCAAKQLFSCENWVNVSSNSSPNRPGAGTDDGSCDPPLTCTRGVLL